MDEWTIGWLPPREVSVQAGMKQISNVGFMKNDK
jgi:hypothetical protein